MANSSRTVITPNRSRSHACSSGLPGRFISPSLSISSSPHLHAAQLWLGRQRVLHWLAIHPG